MAVQAVLRLDAKAEQSAYQVDQPIGIRVTVRNVSKESLTIQDYDDMNPMYMFDAELFQIEPAPRKRIETKRLYIPPKAIHGWKDILLGPSEAWETTINLQDWLKPRSRWYSKKNGVDVDITPDVHLSPGTYEAVILWAPRDWFQSESAALHQNILCSPEIRFQISAP